jgi:hypothetical protein
MSEHAHHHEHPEHNGHHERGAGNLSAMAASATLHCLTGCAIGEVLGLIIGTAAGFSNGATIVLSIALAFLFGYTLSTLPLIKSGMAVAAAVTLVLAADTLSIATMEIVDNLVMTVIPGAMNAGLVNPTFWIGMPASLLVAFFAAYPVNRYLLQRGKGHALTHEHHGATGPVTGPRRFIPTFRTGALVAVIAAFVLGGLTVAVADDLSQGCSRHGEPMSH